MVIALTIITAVMVALLTGLGWLVYKLKPETFHLSAQLYKIRFEVDMKSPPRGNAEGDS